MKLTRLPFLALLLLGGGLRADEACSMGMKVHAPAGLRGEPALVVALHGCTQTAAEFELESGWSALADRLGFVVLYPEQPKCANSMSCFNWFDPAQIARGQGEVKRIRQMVDTVRAQYSIDPARVFVTGFSAGAAMTTAMMAAYPEVFAAGAVMAGLPYRISNGQDALICMFQGKDKTPAAWAGLVRDTHPGYAGPYPRTLIVQGMQDKVINPVNFRETIEQWTAVHGADLTPDASETLVGNTLRTYHDGAGKAVVAALELPALPHAVPVDPGSGPGQAGTVGKWSKDADLSGPWQALRFWGLVP